METLDGSTRKIVETHTETGKLWFATEINIVKWHEQLEYQKASRFNDKEVNLCLAFDCASEWMKRMFVCVCVLLFCVHRAFYVILNVPIK